MMGSRESKDRDGAHEWEPEESERLWRPRVAPGKRTLTMSLPASSAAPRGASSRAESGGAPKRSDGGIGEIARRLDQALQGVRKMDIRQEAEKFFWRDVYQGTLGLPTGEDVDEAIAGFLSSFLPSQPSATRRTANPARPAAAAEPGRGQAPGERASSGEAGAGQAHEAAPAPDTWVAPPPAPPAVIAGLRQAAAYDFSALRAPGGVAWSMDAVLEPPLSSVPDPDRPDMGEGLPAPVPSMGDRLRGNRAEQEVELGQRTASGNMRLEDEVAREQQEYLDGATIVSTDPLAVVNALRSSSREPSAAVGPRLPPSRTAIQTTVLTIADWDRLVQFQTMAARVIARWSEVPSLRLSNPADDAGEPRGGLSRDEWNTHAAAGDRAAACVSALETVNLPTTIELGYEPDPTQRTAILEAMRSLATPAVEAGTRLAVFAAEQIEAIPWDRLPLDPFEELMELGNGMEDRDPEGGGSSRL